MLKQNHTIQICQVCKKLFLSARSLIYHQKTHKCTFKTHYYSVDSVDNSTDRTQNVIVKKVTQNCVTGSGQSADPSTNNCDNTDDIEIDVVQNNEEIVVDDIPDEIPVDSQQTKINNEIVDFIDNKDPSFLISDPYLSSVSNFNPEHTELLRSDQRNVTQNITDLILNDDSNWNNVDCDTYSDSGNINNYLGNSCPKQPDIQNPDIHYQQSHPSSSKCFLNFKLDKDIKKYQCRKCVNVVKRFDTREELYIHHMSVHNQIGSGQNLQPFPWISGQEPRANDEGESELKKIYMLNSALILQPHHYDSMYILFKYLI